MAQPWGGVMTKTEGEGSGRGDRESAASTSRLPPGCFLHTSLFMSLVHYLLALGPVDIL